MVELIPKQLLGEAQHYIVTDSDTYGLFLRELCLCLPVLELPNAIFKTRKFQGV